MKKSTTQGGQVAYRFQRFHSRLETGHYLTTKSKRAEPVRVHFGQSSLDGACGLHVVCAVLVILDLAKSVSLQDMPHRKYGVPALIWSAFSHTYFSGVDAPDLVALTQSLDLPLRVVHKEAVDTDIDLWTTTNLMRGELVAAVIHGTKDRKTKHWVLVVGIEGSVRSHTSCPDTLLLLDPSASEPSFRPHNARMRLATQTSRTAERPTNPRQAKRSSKRSAPALWLYESADFAAEPVMLVSAVRFRRDDWS